MKNLPPLNAVRVFEVSARLGTFSNAAAELGVTQGAVSRQIRLLEDRLGLQLFRRTGRRVNLTQEGRDYYTTVRRALEAIDTKSAQLSRKRARQKLVVSTVPSFATKWLAPRLTSWRTAGPDIDLRIISSYEPTDFRRDGVDVAIRYGRGPWPGLHVERLAVEELFPVCSPGYAKAHRLRQPKDLVRVMLLDREMTEGWAEWLAAVGVPSADLRSIVRMRDAAAALEAALGGQGVALANSSLAAADLASKRLVRPVAGMLVSAHAYHFVCPPSALERHSVDVFRNWIAKEMQRTSAPAARPEVRRRQSQPA